jgi:Short-chain dehydrogenases of various substrate specificities
MAASGQRILIIGATSAMAQHCARMWAERGAAGFVLVGRDVSRLEPIATDLKVRAPQADITLLKGDFDTAEGIEATVEQAWLGGRIDVALIAHGSLPDQAACQRDLQTCNTALVVNGVSPALYAEAITRRMAKAGFGTLGIIGSVAGDRGRRANYVYGAAKGLVTRYAQGLQHRLAGSPVRVTLIKPGPTATPMTEHLQAKGARMAPVEAVAADIVKGMDQGKAVVYAPMKWAIIMMVVRHLPRFIFNKLDI